MYFHLQANRVSVKASFDGAPEQGVIDFGVGQPSADLLPVDLLRGGSERYFASAQALELNYGDKQGDVHFRKALAGFMTGVSGHAATPESLFLSAGNSQALDFICQRFTQPGDTVIVEEPSYFLAFRVFHDHGLNIVGIPMDQHGMDIDRFEQALARHRPRLVYTIPSFHNPTGRTLTGERRERLLALSREHGFTIVADEVYQFLHCGEPPPASFGTMIEQGHVLSLGSFSKILAPSLRLGWIQANADAIRSMLASGVIISGGNFNHFTSHVVRQLLEDGSLARHLAHLRSTYAARVEAMDEALREHLGDWATWEIPRGGYFFWLTLPQGINAADLQAAARQARTGFQPGASCSSSGGLHNCLRLSFAHYSVAEIHEGIGRLGKALRVATDSRV
ncbi:MAG: PLP-dependent aminotransferase family protein [Xanthomonadales bacterium]|nr:PLP-dependent aminotransferase family protein [Xanthomonadales bacterium]